LTHLKICVKKLLVFFVVRTEIEIRHCCGICNTQYRNKDTALRCEKDCAKYKPRFTSEQVVIPRDGLGGKGKIIKWQIWNKEFRPSARKIILCVLENSHIVREEDLILA